MPKPYNGNTSVFQTENTGSTPVFGSTGESRSFMLAAPRAHRHNHHPTRGGASIHSLPQ